MFYPLSEAQKKLANKNKAFSVLIAPVLSPVATEIINFLQHEDNAEKIWSTLDQFSTKLRFGSARKDMKMVGLELRKREDWQKAIYVRFEFPMTSFNLSFSQEFPNSFE